MVFVSIIGNNLDKTEDSMCQGKVQNTWGGGETKQTKRTKKAQKRVGDWGFVRFQKWTCWVSKELQHPRLSQETEQGKRANRMKTT